MKKTNRDEPANMHPGYTSKESFWFITEYGEIDEFPHQKLKANSRLKSSSELTNVGNLLLLSS